MDLWVRSQDKCYLRKITGVYITGGDDGYYIEEYDTDTLGKYKTEQRALEVLEEIQDILIDYAKISSVVYQMPKE